MYKSHSYFMSYVLEILGLINFLQIVQLLLCHGPDINTTEVQEHIKNVTAEIRYCNFSFQIVQLLLRHGADITLRNYENVTAVEVASPAIKTVLLDSVERSTESSHRLLLQAAWQGNVKILRKLLVSVSYTHVAEGDN